MSSVNYSDLHSLLHITTDDVEAEVTESIIDQAIDLINLYANSPLSNMSGDGGSKTVTLTSAQRGAVFEVAKSIYHRDYHHPVPTQVADAGAQPVDVPEPLRVARQVAAMLASYTITRT